MKDAILNKKTIAIGIITVVIFIISVLCALVPINKMHDKNGQNWMQNLSDQTKICDLSIPGTHDSGATHSIFDVSGKCQDISIKSQLNVGVRFLDLRLQLVNNEFQVVHSFVKQNLKLKSVVNDLKNFLTKNPSEFILVSVKQEADAQNSSLQFEPALISELEPLKNNLYLGEKLPETVGEARGKIILISRYNGQFGIPAYFGWLDDDCFELNDFYVQDNYSIDDIQDKKNSITTALNYAKNSSDKLVLNFTSCYLNNAFPPTYAGTSALEINPWFEDYLQNNQGKRV